MSDKPQQPDRLQVLSRLWQYLFHYKWMLILAILLNLVSNLFTLVGPLLSGYAIDAIQPGTGRVLFQEVFFYCALMIALYVVSSILQYVMSVLIIKLTQRTVHRMRKDVFDKLTQLPVGYFDQHQAGDTISRITFDINTVNTSLSSDFIQILTSLVTILGSLVMMILISPILVLVFVVTIPISIFLTKYLTTKFRPLFRKRSAKLGELNGFVEEILSGQQAIKVYNQEEHTLARFDGKNLEAVEATYDSDYYGSMIFPFINFINNLSLSLIGVFGALLFLNGNLSLGSLSSFVLYSRRFSGPINEISSLTSELQSAFAAAERVFHLIDEPPEPADVPNAHVFEHVKGDVRVADVSFGYSPDRLIMKNVSLEAPAGSQVAIVGPTGAGKTTLINLLMRFYDPDQGAIYLDGINIKDATRSSLRRSYAMVLQDAWLFTGTVYENLAYGKEGATLEEVQEAAQAARIHRYIMQLPKGYDTVLDEDGMNISQGQKQLLTIARAMLLDASLLILDEATSNVDTQTELQIQAAMKKLMKGKTSFIIAHRLSTIRNADTILVVQDGNIVEQGNHEQLLQKKGLYSELYQSQFDSST